MTNNSDEIAKLKTEFFAKLGRMDGPDMAIPELCFTFRNYKTGHEFLYYMRLNNIGDFVFNYDKAISTGYAVIKCVYVDSETGATLDFLFLGWKPKNPLIEIPDELSVMDELMNQKI